MTQSSLHSEISFNSNPGAPSPVIIAGYTLEERLGSGSFANVYKASRKYQNELNHNSIEHVAIKAIARDSNKLTKKVLENLELEISILQKYRHANIVCLHRVQKTDQFFYLILEFCGGGDLQRLIRTRKSGRLSEQLVRRLVRDLAAGLTFLSSQNLIHRDIKPQNLLLTGPLPLDEENDPSCTEEMERDRKRVNFDTNKFHLKIADFGFARHLQKTSLADTLCGSPLYMAPEILQHQR
jgi:serine/threonine-protein kinase ULK/ATG1